MDTEDPWHDMEAELEAALKDLMHVRERYRGLLGEVLRGRRDPNSTIAAAGVQGLQESQAAERQAAELITTMAQRAASLEQDLAVLQESVSAVEGQPDKYNVPTVEVRRRKDVTEGFQQRINRVKADVDDARRRVARTQGDGAPGGAQGGDTSLGQFMAQEYDAQRDLRADQDVVLERIGHGVKEAHAKAEMIGEELDQQEKELTGLEADIAAVQVRLEGAVKRVATLLEKTSDRGKIGIIFVLLLVLVGLVTLLFQ